MQSRDYFPTMKELTFIRQDPSDQLCIELLWRKRFEGMTCPKCGKDGRFYYLNNRPTCYSHGGCGQHVSVLAGTIFEKSAQSLVTWFEVIHLVYISEGKVPAKELERQLGVTYKTAWRMKDVVCEYLGLNKSYTYEFSSKENGRFAQMRRQK